MSRIPVKTVRITHYSADNENFRYTDRGVDAIVKLLFSIPENSLSHLECVYLRV
jgi:hypothetical protein